MRIEIEGLNKAFGEKVVLSNFSTVLNEGITAINGASGAGKSTLLNILAGLVEPDSGRIDGLSGLRVSYVFQEERLLPWFSARRNIELVCRDKKLATILLEEMEIADAADKNVRKLSGGMQRRVALARALSADYDLLLLDEPFKGLDERTKYRVMDVTKRRARGIIVLVTHDLYEAEYLGARQIPICKN